LKHYRILFVERYRTVEREVLPALLQNYEVDLVRGRREAMTSVDERVPDLVLIDVPSIRFDLERFCHDLKERIPGISLFFLLGKGMRLDSLPRHHDFLRHDFTTRQLLNRLSRSLPEELGEVIGWQGLELDCTTNALTWKVEDVFLTPKQAALMTEFLRAPEELLSRAWLMQEVWGTDYLGDTRTLDVHVHWLRKALRSLKAPFRFQTVRGKGYRFLSTRE
jgi:DNA-binding response OmpR family regulator